MAIENWLTQKAIKAVYDALEKSPVRIKNLLGEERELVIWVSQPSGNGSKKLSSKTSR